MAGRFGATDGGGLNRIVGALVLVALLVASCGGEPPSGQAPTATAESPQEASEAVEFEADDGTRLIGRVWGNGDVGVVLAHGFSPGTGQDDWEPFQPVLADEGYTVLTFNFRAFCSDDGCSGGEMELGNNWKDVVAAIDFLQGRGVEDVFLVGASMGGLAVLRAASLPEVEAAGVVSLSTPQFPSKYYFEEPVANDVTPERLRQITEPKLFVAGKEDVQRQGEAPLRPEIEEVRFADDARRMYEASADPRQLALVDSGFHSSDLVTTAEDEIVTETRGLILRFLEGNS